MEVSRTPCVCHAPLPETILPEVAMPCESTVQSCQVSFPLPIEPLSSEDHCRVQLPRMVFATLEY